MGTSRTDRIRAPRVRAMTTAAALLPALLLAAAGCGGSGGTGPAATPTGWWSGLAPRGLAVGEILGMATQMYDGPEPRWERDFEIERLLDAGLLRLRASVDWSDVEPAQDAWDFGTADAFVELVTGAGLQFDGRLCYGVDWARPPGNDSALRPEDFADYAGTVAGRYCGVIGSYEIWNEENHPRFWQPAPDPDHFGRILKASFEAIHRACPDARVVFGGLSCFDPASFRNGMYDFLEQVCRAHPDIGRYFDVLAIHPYTFLQTTSPEWSWEVEGVEVWPTLEGQIRIARDRLEAIGAAGKAIWLTEWGWPSLIVGDAAQAAFLARGALEAISQGVEALDWYTFWDREGGSFPPTEDYFGLFTHPASEGGPAAKPAYQTARTLSRVLGASRYAGDVSGALDLPDGARALAFLEEESGAITLAGWDAVPLRETGTALPCPPGAVSFRVRTDLGETLADGACPGGPSIELGKRVVYARFDLRAP